MLAVADGSVYPRAAGSLLPGSPFDALLTLASLLLLPSPTCTTR
jgi:hypothetical protein